MSAAVAVLSDAIEAFKLIAGEIKDEVEKKKMMDYIDVLEKALKAKDIHNRMLTCELDKVRKDLIFKTDEVKEKELIIINRDNKIAKLELVISQLKGGAI